MNGLTQALDAAERRVEEHLAEVGPERGTRGPGAGRGELVVDELVECPSSGWCRVSGGNAYPDVRQDPDAAFRDAMEAQLRRGGGRW